MRRRPPRSTRTDTLVPYTTLFRSRGDAVSLLPEGGNLPDAPVMLGIVRDAGADADPEIWVSRAAKGRETLDFLVDGRKIASVTSVNGEASVPGTQASALAIAIAKGGGMEIRAGGRLIARPSLAVVRQHNRLNSRH